MRLTCLGRYGPYPKPGDSACSCYVVEDGGAKLVLDMGPGSLRRLTAFTDVKDIDAIWLSHMHYDHTSDLLAFRYLLEDLDVRMKVIACPDESDYCRVLLAHPLFEVIPVKAGDSLDIKGLRLSFYEMEHPAYDLAIRMDGSKSLVYTGDTVYTPELERACRGADAVLADCSKPAGFTGPHMTVVQAARLAQLTGAKILATHLSPFYDPTSELAGSDDIAVVRELESREI